MDIIHFSNNHALRQTEIRTSLFDMDTGEKIIIVISIDDYKLIDMIREMKAKKHIVFSIISKYEKRITKPEHITMWENELKNRVIQILDTELDSTKIT